MRGDLAAEWTARERPPLWREASDLVNLLWLAGAAPPLRGCRVLKTDLFDEAFGRGLLWWALQQGAEATACDVCEAVVERASAREPRMRTFAGDVRRLALAPGSIDLVLSNSTLDHFESLDDVSASLREYQRILRPGGRLLLSMDNPCNPLLFLRGFMPGFLRRLGVVAFDVGASCRPRSLQSLVREAGFAVETTGAIFHAPRVAVVWACNLLERRGRNRLPRWLSGMLLGTEKLGRWPTRYLTGHFITISARKT